MNEKVKLNGISVFAVLYGLFTAVCLCVGIRLSEYRLLIFSYWYISGVAVWFTYAITLLLMSAQLFKIKAMKKQHKKSRDRR